MNRPHAIDPWDACNQSLAAIVSPADWTNPEPAVRYNLVVLGAGTAGLVAAAAAAGLGARVALVERALMGGDCLNFGCVPSKAMLRSGRAAAAVRDAPTFGVKIPKGVEVDFPAVMKRMRETRAGIAHNDGARRFAQLGVDVFLGEGRFTGPDSVDVAGRSLRFVKAVIATGARAARPAIPGLDPTAVLTNETVFSLTELPTRLGIVGAGPIGCELAQCFARFGAAVTLVESDRGLLPREDRDAAAFVRASMLSDGVMIRPGARAVRASTEAGVVRLSSSGPDGRWDAEVDKVLLAAGRIPNVAGFGLEAAGVDFDESGVRVDDRLRTTNPRIFACGDVCSPHQFTHAADFMARIVVQNALFMGRARFSSLVIPRCTFTSPEIGAFGWSATEAANRGIEVDTFTQNLADLDRAVLDGEANGFVRVLVRKGTDRILGATVVAGNAGDLVGELTLAVRAGAGLKTIGSAIHPYPTMGEAVRRLGDQYARTRLTPFARRLLARWFAFTR
jgi:pyruvate/2-oxoglutarate dehydrogenase complex dihydrolipoamide dehydrogenase (E3) component